LFISSTILGVLVILSLSLYMCVHACAHACVISMWFFCIYCVLWHCTLFWLLQTGLLSAYIIKKLYFGRLVNHYQT
jgi:hypothetical protein